QFGTFEWSSSEGHLLYMAEKKRPTARSFLDPKAFKDDPLGGEEAEDDLKDEKATGKNEEVLTGEEFVSRDIWGETLEERSHPVICVLDIEASTVSMLENLPEDVSPGQAMWSPDDAGIVVCGWIHEPYRLGLKHCCQRQSALYYIDLQKTTVEVLSEPDRAVRFPRFCPDMSKLIYLDTPVGGGHHQCARLIKIDWASRKKEVVLDIVRYAPDPKFPGIYCAAMSRNVWFEDNVHLALSTFYRSRQEVVIINTDSCKIQRVKIDGEPGSVGLLCVRKNYLVLQCSSPNTPSHLVFGKVNDPSDVSDVSWIFPDGQPEVLDWLSWSIIQHTPTKDRVNDKFESLDYESILCLPKTEKGDPLPPLIVFSHGGPNSAFDSSYVDIVAFFCRCRYAAVQVNYRGSLGFGQDSVDSLLGTIGTQDVKDVESAMVDVIAKGVADGNCIFAFGGSHGGFLSTHLIGQYPDTFKAAATRNPVVNLVSMFSTTDISDWIFAQAGLQFNFKSLADDKLLPQLWKASPISYIDQVKTPLLLMLGLADLRVPPFQGKEYWRALKARNVPVRLLTYPGNNHSISNVEAEADCMLNTVVWFNKHLPAKANDTKLTFIKCPV
ncbi:acylamino-acid-releasing enzyme-like, partial [Plakobranchus ocellatus]